MLKLDFFQFFLPQQPSLCLYDAARLWWCSCKPMDPTAPIWARGKSFSRPWHHALGTMVLAGTRGASGRSSILNHERYCMINDTLDLHWTHQFERYCHCESLVKDTWSSTFVYTEPWLSLGLWTNGAVGVWSKKGNSQIQRKRNESGSTPPLNNHKTKCWLYHVMPLSFS